jgi:hypothetical protein
MGPVERAIRGTFSAPMTLETLARRKPFTLNAMPGDGILLALGETGSAAHISWECLEGVPAFLRVHPGWVRAGGAHVATGEPGTLDEHLKRDLQTHVAYYVTDAYPLVTTDHKILWSGGRLTRCPGTQVATRRRCRPQ